VDDAIAAENELRDSEEEGSTPVCGEFVLDVKKANFDTKVGHECGEWRPMVMVPSPGGSTEDYSWHHPPRGYSGSGGTPSGGPVPLAQGRIEGSSEVNPNSQLLDEDIEVDPIEITPSADIGSSTQQSSWGWTPAMSPEGGQRVNVLRYLPTLNTSGTIIKMKPQGYSKLKFQIWITVSDAIAAGEKIEVEIRVGQGKNDRTPETFQATSILLDSTNVTAGEWKRVNLEFPGYDHTKARMLTIYVTRRNDSTYTPISAVEVWTMTHRLNYRA
jgi:hypothetical protein